jgi:hypothetical protein
MHRLALTILKIRFGIDAIPFPHRTASRPTLATPRIPPPQTGGTFSRRRTARATLGAALAVTDGVGCRADACRRIVCGARGEPVETVEAAWVAIDASGHGVVWVIASGVGARVFDLDEAGVW